MRAQTSPDTLPAVDRPLEEGWTLPARWYTDTAVQWLERERIFSSAWAYAGPAAWVSEPGSYFAAQVGHIPVAVVRGSGRRPPRPRERLPTSRAPRRRGHGVPGDAAVPVPRLDVRPRRRARARAALRARAGLRPDGPLARADLRRHVGAVRLREPGSRRAAARRVARRDPVDRRGERPRSRRAPLPLAPRVADRGQLEGRDGELPRVLPLPDRAPRVQQGDRRQPRRVPPPGARDLLEPDRRRSAHRRSTGTARRRTRPRAT